MVGTGTKLDFEDKASYTVTVGATDPDKHLGHHLRDNHGGQRGRSWHGHHNAGHDPAGWHGTDGLLGGPRWERGEPDVAVAEDDGQGNYADIPGATRMSYTPVMADDGSRLQATAMYDDSFGEDKTAKGMTANAVGATCDIVCRYDTDDTPGISEIEASIAVLDHLFRGDITGITRDQAIQVVTAYLETADCWASQHGHRLTVNFGPEQEQQR